MNPKNRLAPFAATAVLLIASAGSASASVVGVGWKSISPTQAELYAVVDSDTTRVLGGELNNMPVGGGTPTGLYSEGGNILDTTQIFIGGESIIAVADPMVTPVGTGSLFEATWGTLSGGALPMLTDLDDGSLLAVLLLRVDVEHGALLGGEGSSISVGFSVNQQSQDLIFTIPQVPMPSTMAMAGVALLGLTRRRR